MIHNIENETFINHDVLTGGKGMEDYYCDVCGLNMKTEMMQTEKIKGIDIDVLFAVCPECDNRINFLFDSKDSLRWKKKLNQLREIETYILAMIQLEGTKAADKYYEYEYNNLTAEEKEIVGSYQPVVTNERTKEYLKHFDKPKWTDLLKLL